MPNTVPNRVIQRLCVGTTWNGASEDQHREQDLAEGCGQGRKWTWNSPWKHRAGRGPGCADIGSHPAGGPRHAEIGKGTDQDSGRAPAGTHVHKDLCNKTIIPGFLVRTSPSSLISPCREFSVPRSLLLALPSSQALTLWATQTCNCRWHQ